MWPDYLSVLLQKVLVKEIFSIKSAAWYKLLTNFYLVQRTN